MMWMWWCVMVVGGSLPVGAVERAEQLLQEAERLEATGASLAEVRDVALQAGSTSPETHAASAAFLVVEINPTGAPVSGGDGGLLPKVGRPQPVQQQEARLMAALALGDLAAGRRAAARTKMADPEVEAALQRVSAFMPGGYPALRRDAALRDRAPRTDDPWLAARGVLLGWGSEWDSADTMSLRMDVDWVPEADLEPIRP